MHVPARLHEQGRQRPGGVGGGRRVVARGLEMVVAAGRGYFGGVASVVGVGVFVVVVRQDVAFFHGRRAAEVS